MAACLAPLAVFAVMVAAPDGAREPLRWLLYASCAVTLVAVVPRTRVEPVVRVLGVVGAVGFGGGAAYLHSLADEPSAIPLAGGLAFLLGGVLLLAAACTVAAGRGRRPVVR